MQIFKFGGASVKDAEGVKNLGKVVTQFGDEQMVIIVSAMGKTTNHLENISGLAVNGQPYKKELDELLQYHRQIIDEIEIEVPNSYKDTEHSLMDWCQKVKGEDVLWSYDQIVCHGELMSTQIIEAYLSLQCQSHWLDARKLIRTDQYFTEANVDWVVTEKQIRKSIIDEHNSCTIVTQGFIGADAEGNSTTLGREGSDFSGSILAYCLGADRFTVWKDVKGILNADPRIMDQTEKYDFLSYREVTEMTYYGAQVIHPKTLKPLAQKSIPLEVRSFEELEAPGTLISSRDTQKTIPCFIFKGNQLLVTSEVKDHNFMNEQKLGMILQVLDLLNIKINLMQNSALTFSFCIDNKEFKAKRIKELLNRDFILSFEGPLNLATIKNYQDDSFQMLPMDRKVLMEQKTATNYQVLYW
ncbi:MAG: aspartate kinase [Cyclobacteriaceae bacterium]